MLFSLLYELCNCTSLCHLSSLQYYVTARGPQNEIPRRQFFTDEKRDSVFQAGLIFQWVESGYLSNRKPFRYTHCWLRSIAEKSESSCNSCHCCFAHSHMLLSVLNNVCFLFNYFRFEESSAWHADYKPINSGVTPFAVKADGLPQLNTDGIITGKNLFNGNINSMLVNVPKIGEARLYGYRYDQLNRIKAMNAYSGLNTATNAITPAVMADYKERVSYDANGNIESYLRNGTTANSNQLAMDDLTYHYTSGTNKLNRVADAVGDGNYTIDIDNQSSVNYEYDAIGNMVRDKAEGLYDASDPTKDMIEWNVYGKISRITKIKNSVTTVIEYRYDAAGNRIEKKVGSKITAYVRDATGNVMAVYEKGGEVNSGHLTQVEVHLYGSSRLGLWRGDRDVEITDWQLFDTDPMQGTTNGILPEKWVRGKTIYELSNHLGNVLVTISDKKLGIDETSDEEIDRYESEIVSANDYYPFGMLMPGRTYNAGHYAYGFNGKRMDNDVKGTGNSYDYGARIYDPRVVRFLSVDPLTKTYPWYTPYQFAGNTPIWAIDVDGMEPKPFNKWGTWVNITEWNSYTPEQRKDINVVSFGNIGGDEKSYIAVRDQQDVKKWHYLNYEKALGSFGNIQKTNWQLNVAGTNKYEPYTPDGFIPDDMDIKQRAQDIGKFGKAYERVIINAAIFGLTAGTGSTASLATKLIYTRLGTTLGDIGSQAASGKSFNEMNLTSIGLSASTGLPAFTTSFISSAAELSFKGGTGNTWGILGGKKSTRQVVIETSIGGLLGTFGGAGNTNLGAGTGGLYRNLRLSFNQTGARFGMTLLPASTSFGTNYVGNVVGNASQKAEDASKQTKDEKAF